MKSALFLFLLFFCISAYAQEQPPIQLSLCVLVKTALNSQQRYSGNEKGSLTINLNANGTYSEVEVTTPFIRSKKTYGTFKINTDQIQFNSDEGTVKTYTITQIDPYITKMVEGEQIFYFTRSPITGKN